jgi:hypothetical protein
MFVFVKKRAEAVAPPDVEVVSQSGSVIGSYWRHAWSRCRW